MTILWDWNGTLVADVPHVVAMNNQVLEQFGYRHTSEEEYRAKFRHPVHEYYYDLGVTAEDFPKIAKVWNKAYVDGFDCVPLAPGVADAVRRFHDAGFRQAIISASQVDQLRAQVKHFPELDGMFDTILGLDNQLAVSKVHLAQEFLKETGLTAEECVFIGDTTHDAETAAGIGCRCYLVAGGHQEESVLHTAANAVVVDSIGAVLEALGVQGMSAEKNWLAEVQRMAQAGDPQAMALFAQHRDETLHMLIDGAAGASDTAQGGNLMERDTRETAAIVAKWSVYALPLTEDVLEITADISRWGETPLITARTEDGEVVLFDTAEASRTNEAHLEDCRHVEASWGDWQDVPGFFDLFCDALTSELTVKGLPAPHYIRRDA